MQPRHAGFLPHRDGPEELSWLPQLASSRLKLAVRWTEAAVCLPPVDIDGHVASRHCPVVFSREEQMQTDTHMAETVARFVIHVSELLAS